VLSGKRLGAGALALIVGRLTTAASALAMAAIAAQLLTQDDLGAYFLVISLITVGSVVGQIGLSRSLLRAVATAAETRDAVGVRVNAIAGLALGSIGALCVASAVGVGSSLMGLSPIAAISIAVWLFAVALVGLMGEVLRGLHRIGASSLVSGGQLGGGLAAIAGCALLFVVAARQPDMALEGLLLLLALVALTNLGVSATLVWQALPSAAVTPTKIACSARAILAPAPMTLSENLTYIATRQVDIVLVALVFPLPEVALYGVATRLAAILAMVPALGSTLFSATIAQHASAGRFGDLERLLGFAAAGALVPAVVMVAGLALFGNGLVATVFGPDYVGAIPLLLILASGQLVTIATGVATTVLGVTGHHRALAGYSAGGAALACGLIVVLMPVMGLAGAAFGAATGQALPSLLAARHVRRTLGISTYARINLPVGKAAVQ
jgi:O-antigen/teichoic acid export membrane protein